MDQWKLIQRQLVQSQARQLNRESRMLRFLSWLCGAQRSANGDLLFRVFVAPSVARKLRDSTTRQDSMNCEARGVALHWTFRRSQQVETVVRPEHECQLNPRIPDQHISAVPRPDRGAVRRLAIEHQTQRCSLPANCSVNVAAARNPYCQIRRHPPLTFNRLFDKVSQARVEQIRYGTC